MPAIEAILFDLGNTLIYFNADWREALGRAQQAALDAFQRGGLPVDNEQFLQTFRRALENHYARREDDLIERTTLQLLREVMTGLGYAQISDSLLDDARRAFYRITQAHWQPEADALPTLRALRQQGYRLAILSNAADDWDVQTLVDKVKARPYLDFVLSSAAFGVRKPSPAIFQAALDRWGLPPARVAMIGDTLNADVLGANQTGLFSVWITRRAEAGQSPARARPDAIIKTLAELPGVMTTG